MKRANPARRDREIPYSSQTQLGGSASKRRLRRYLRPVRLAGSALLVASVPSASSFAYTPPPQDFFPVGVFLQPVENFDAWKSRGVNTVVDFAASSQSLETWNAAAVARSLYMIRAP